MLGLRPDPGVSRKEVKQAFRRLAREWHPDVNPSPEASHRFQAISRAFEVLSDEQQRWEYEQARFGGSGSEGSDGGGGPGPGSRAPRGRERAPPDVWAELRLGFREAVLGAQRSVLLEVQDACGQCQGTGGQPGTYSPPCSMCKGRGEIVRLQRGTLPNGCAAAAGTAVVCCPVCGGRGFRVLHPCSCCGGEGLTQQPRRVAVHVPAGVDSGSTLRLGAEGSVGRASGPRGAVVLELKVAQEEGIWRRGLDLHSQLAVPLWDVCLGGTTTVATLHGDARLAIPPGTQHGAVLSVPRAGVRREGRGPRPCGSHHFEVLVQLPREVSGVEARLLQRLAQLQGEQQQPWAG